MVQLLILLFLSNIETVNLKYRIGGDFEKIFRWKNKIFQIYYKRIR